MSNVARWRSELRPASGATVVGTVLLVALVGPDRFIVHGCNEVAPTPPFAASGAREH